MFFIEHTTDFEFYSGNSKGAIQGHGYVFHKGQYLFSTSVHIFILMIFLANTYGPRILRLHQVTSFSVHGIVLVDCMCLSNLTIFNCFTLIVC